MIIRISILAFFTFLIPVNANSQETGPGNSNIQLDRFNHKDYNSFREYIQRNAIFPPEAFDCTGVLLAGFTLSPKGEIKNVFTLNSLSPSIDNQILDLFESTGRFWNPLPGNELANRNSIIIFPIVFCLKNTEYDINGKNLKIMLQEEILLTAMMGQGQMSATNYITTDNLKISLTELITRGKYDKANLVVRELLRREPLNTEYYVKLIEIEARLGNTDNACKDFKFVKTYLIQQPDKMDFSCN